MVFSLMFFGRARYFYRLAPPLRAPSTLTHSSSLCLTRNPQSSVVPASARWRATKGSLDAYRGLFFHGMSKLFTMNTSINFAHNSSRMNTCDLKDLKYLKNEYFRRKPRGEGRIVMFMLEFQTGPLMSASDRSIQ